MEKVKIPILTLGTGIDYSIKEVALMVKNIVGFSGGLVFNTSRPDSAMDRLMDCSKIHSLGWKHKIDLEKGIQMMYKWYKNNNGGGELLNFEYFIFANNIRSFANSTQRVCNA